MKGCLRKKTAASGNSYYYVKLRYTDPETGRTKEKLLQTGLSVRGNKRAAEKVMEDYLQEYAYLEEKVEHKEHSMMMTEFIDIYCASLEGKTLARSTTTSYISKSRRIKAYFETHDIPLDELKSTDVDDFCAYCHRAGKRDQKTNRGKPCAQRTVNDYKAQLGRILEKARRDRYIPSNPVREAEHEKKKGDRRGKGDRYPILDSFEIPEFCTFLGTNYPRIYYIAYFAICFGLRREELLGLKWSAIDSKNGCMHIRHTVVRNADGSISRENMVKSAAAFRDLPMSENDFAMLDEISSAKKQLKKFYGNTYQDSDYIFTWDDGRLYDPDYISKQFSKALKQFGRPDLTLHKLRHTFVSHLVNAGCPVGTVQQLAGHEDAETTLNIYNHFLNKSAAQSQKYTTELSALAYSHRKVELAEEEKVAVG